MPLLIHNAVQDFTFHVLRNCHVVLMVARDEGASFRIFSSLNGRGMDLTEVDKLKADLLQVGQQEERVYQRSCTRAVGVGAWNDQGGAGAQM